MQILCTVTGTGPARDIWLDGEPGAPFAALAAELEDRGLAAAGRPWWNGTRLLEMDPAIGHTVLDGAVLSQNAPTAGSGGPTTRSSTWSAT